MTGNTDVFDVDLDAEPNSLSDAGLTALVIGQQRQLDLHVARYAKALVVFHQRKAWAEDGSRSSGHALARETNSSPRDMKRNIKRARLLDVMPLVMAQFLAGDLSESRVNLLCAYNKLNVRELFARDEQMLLDLIKPLTFHKAERVLAYWAMHADPDGTEDRNKYLYESRYLRYHRNSEGVLVLDGQLDPVGSEIVENELQRLANDLFKQDWAEAKEFWGDEVSISKLKRTNAQRLADAQVSMAIRSAAKAPGAKEGRVLATITCGSDSFKQLMEMGSGTVIATGAVIPYLSDTDIETMLFDGKHRVTDYINRRSFRGALERIIKVRDGYCTDPSVCDVPADKCQIDHNEAWSWGGRTTQENGKCLCAPHNRRKGSGPPNGPPQAA